MRFASACLVGSLPVPLLVPLCVASFLRPASRAVWRAARPRLPPRLPALRLSCLPPTGSPSSWLSRIADRPVFPLSRPSPRRSCRTSGETSPYLLLPCGEVLARVASLSLSYEGCLCLLGVRFCSRLKTLLGNFLKPFPGNLLDTIKHIHLPICSVLSFCGLRRSVSPPAVSLFSLSFVF